ADETPEGRSIVVLAKEKYGLRGREVHDAGFIEFTAQTRVSGVDLPDGTQVRKGAANAVRDWVRDSGGHVDAKVGETVDAISAAGGTPLVVAQMQRPAGGAG